jgi:hypothetical protein
MPPLMQRIVEPAPPRQSCGDLKDRRKVAM